MGKLGAHSEHIFKSMNLRFGSAGMEVTTVSLSSLCELFGCQFSVCRRTEFALVNFKLIR